jgi:hypothetical protein
MRSGSVHFSRRQVARICYRNARELGASAWVAFYVAITAWHRRPNGLTIDLEPGAS